MQPTRPPLLVSSCDRFFRSTEWQIILFARLTRDRLFFLASSGFERWPGFRRIRFGADVRGPGWQCEVRHRPPESGGAGLYCHSVEELQKYHRPIDGVLEAPGVPQDGTAVVVDGQLAGRVTSSSLLARPDGWCWSRVGEGVKSERRDNPFRSSYLWEITL
jgi:hypothetical protein